ncbi:MAG: Response regulator PleD [Myxococcota bacterium]|nr:Response regulator PleD [Myxococcota bacterium]
MEKVLLILDGAELRRRIADILQSNHFEPVFGEDRAATLKLAADNPVSVALVDYGEQEGRGLDMLVKLATQEATWNVPVIAIPDDYSGKVVGEVIEGGGMDCIRHDADAVEVIARVKAALRVRRHAKRLEIALDELRDKNEQLAALAVTDGLTLLNNHSHFIGILNQELARARRFGQPLSLVLCDLDNFKRVNDTLGHRCGDQVLRETASRMRESARSIDILGRYGGEEFALILPGTDREGALVVCERFRASVADLPFTLDNNGEALEYAMTVSVGLATVPSNGPLNSASLIEAADRAMYRAKRGGKNRVCVYDSEQDGHVGNRSAITPMIKQRQEPSR